MQYLPFEEGIEVNGQTVLAIVDGFTFFKKTAVEMLLREGIGNKLGDGSVAIDTDRWYSQSAWLRAFSAISASGGASVLFRIGLKIPENAAFPPWVTDVESAIRAIDIAYHMNHRKGGAVMFNAQSAEMLEGIGHYGCERLPDKNEIISVCENPYPCDFDHGIVTAMAQKFAPGAKITHAAGSCRKNGDSKCVYVVRW